MPNFRLFHKNKQAAFSSTNICCKQSVDKFCMNRFLSYFCDPLLKGILNHYNRGYAKL